MNEQISGQPRLGNRSGVVTILTLVVMGGVFGLVTWLLLTPAGVSRLVVEVTAENVWSPAVLTAVWRSENGEASWQVPFAAHGGEPTSITLEVVANETTDTPGEVWLIGAFQPNGTLIAADGFQAGAGWEQRDIDRGPYQDVPAWVSLQGQGAALHWSGIVDGPLTLTFLRHPGAGSVTIHLNGTSQTFDLRHPDLALMSVTGDPEAAVWHAALPQTALRDGRLDFLVRPDPWGNFPTQLKEVRLLGGSAEAVSLNGPELLEALTVEYGQATLDADRIKLNADTAGEVLHVAVDISSLAETFRGPLLSAGLENFVVLLTAVAGGAIVALLLLRLLPGPVVINFNLAVISLLFALVLGEVAARFYLPPPGTYYPHAPNIQRRFQPAPGVMPGVEGESRFVTNSRGLRSDELPASGDYHILAIGGSTTECVYLDQSEAWPQLLQTHLNDTAPASVWVGNAGRSGHNSREHILQMKYLLPQYPALDVVVLLAGVNDLGLRLRRAEAYNPHYMRTYAAEETLLSRAFAVYQAPQPNPNLPHYTQTGLWRLLERLAQEPTSTAETVASIDVEDEAGLVYIERREQRRNSPLREKLPDLSTALEEYRRNLHRIVELAQRNEVRLILMTQPSMWRPDLSRQEESLLWGGYGPNRDYFYEAAALAEGMSAYNRVLLEVCEQSQAECIDLTSLLPKDTTVFYDDVHFNERGAAQVAEAVATYLLSQPPFKSAIQN